MVSPIQFPSPVMRFDPETRSVVVARRDPDTGVITSQAPTEATLQLDREERAASERAAQLVQTAPPTNAATVVVAAAPAPPAPAATPPASVIAATATTATTAAHLSVFV
jgi:hypothetical protein